jgi:hypothetical protein
MLLHFIVGVTVCLGLYALKVRGTGVNHIGATITLNLFIAVINPASSCIFYIVNF